jgi:peptidoglycan hydrolase-like protein with peptidoglycan-binding domain
VRGFQDALGLAVDGVVGPLTRRALVSGMLAG